MNWNNIESDLKSLYQKYNLMDGFEADKIYLKSSYEKIEKLWLEIYNKIDSIISYSKKNNTMLALLFVYFSTTFNFLCRSPLTNQIMIDTAKIYYFLM